MQTHTTVQTVAQTDFSKAERVGELIDFLSFSFFSFPSLSSAGEDSRTGLRNVSAREHGNCTTQLKGPKLEPFWYRKREIGWSTFISTTQRRCQKLGPLRVWPSNLKGFDIWTSYYNCEHDTREVWLLKCVMYIIRRAEKRAPKTPFSCMHS